MPLSYYSNNNYKVALIVVIFLLSIGMYNVPNFNKT